MSARTDGPYQIWDYSAGIAIQSTGAASLSGMTPSRNGTALRIGIVMGADATVYLLDDTSTIILLNGGSNFTQNDYAQVDVMVSANRTYALHTGSPAAINYLMVWEIPGTEV